MPSGRRKVKASEASEAVAAWRASKRSLSDWCAAEGIDGRSLGYWAGRLSAEPVAIRVVEVSAPPGAPALPASRGPSLRLHVAGMTVEIPDGFCRATLTEVLSVVRGC